jgi:hypothetical protein
MREVMLSLAVMLVVSGLALLMLSVVVYFHDHDLPRWVRLPRLVRKEKR